MCFLGGHNITEWGNCCSKAVSVASKQVHATFYSLMIFVTGHSELNSMICGVTYMCG